MNNLIITKQEQGILHIQLNRLNKKNALNNAMYLQLSSLLQSASDNHDIRCILIYGDQNCFTAGNDLHDFIATQNDSDLAALEFIEILASFNKPLIAAVAGPAIGIGTTLLLHCDLVFAAINSKFALPFTQLGLCPEAGSSLLLTERVGASKAFELLVLGDTFTAEQAHQYGLVNHLCTNNELISLATNAAQKVAKLPVDSVMTSRRLIRQASKALLPDAMKAEVKEFTRLVQSQECKSILTALLNK